MTLGTGRLRLILGCCCLALAVVLRAGVASADGAGYGSTVLNDAPDGYWHLGEAGGSASLADASGHGRNAAVTGTWAQGTSLVSGGDGSGVINAGQYGAAPSIAETG